MIKKITSIATISALSAVSLVAIAGAFGNGYASFSIANGDPNEEGQTARVKIQPAMVVEGPSVRLNIGAGDDNDKPAPVFTVADFAEFTIASGDPNEEGTAGQAKVQPALFDSAPSPRLNIGAGDDNDKPVAPTADVVVTGADESGDGTTGQVRVQPAQAAGPSMLNIGAGDDADKPAGEVEATAPAAPADDSDDTPAGPGGKLNIGASDPAEQQA